jgi:anti-sigma regulatory factor (Ser/Thr protein kinase)
MPVTHDRGTNPETQERGRSEGLATTHTVDLPFEPASVREARRLLASDAASAGVQEPERADALVVVSELVGNALRHARALENGMVRVMWRILPDEVEVAVADGGAPTAPRADRPPFAALSGRGLGIVDALSETWGVEGAGTDHQLVWAVVPRGTLRRHGDAAAGERDEAGSSD